MRENGYWKTQRVLVTGATGFLGGWLVKSLLERGATVVALIRDGSPRSMLYMDALVDQIASVRGDVLDYPLLRRTCSEYEVTTLFHLAAQTIVGVAANDPISTLETNIRGTWNVLEAARQSGVKETVVASSDKAYGPAVELPYREEHPLQGRYPYDASKSCADLLCTMYAKTYGLPVAIVRCANLFGGGDLNFSRTIPGVILSTLNSERFLIRSDGKFVRDFLYVRDAASAYLCLAEALAKDASLSGEGFNFGLGAPVTVLEVVERVLSLMGRSDLQPVIQNIVKAEIREQWLAADKAARVLGWTAEFSLDEGLRETIEWYREYCARTGMSPVMADQASAGR